MEFNIYECIQDADMVLVGLGEEFDCSKYISRTEGNETLSELEKSLPWFLPAYSYYAIGDGKEKILKCLNRLKDLLQDKNYFVLSTSTNRMIKEVEWKSGNLVMPCGNMTHLQCENGCEGSLRELTAEDEVKLQEFAKCPELILSQKEKINFGNCEKCGAPLVLNNYYNQKYDENGYLDMWKLYTKWLQGTLNKKLLILELGAGFVCPSVMRWPFEKVAFYNQKAKMFRVNEKLYHLTDDLKEKGCSVSQNAIEWLNRL